MAQTARAKLPDELDDLSWDEHRRLSETVDYFNENYQKYIGRILVADDLSEANFPNILAFILKQKILESMQGRDNLSYIQMFNFLYSDNAPMLTLGGVIISSGHKDKYISDNFQNVNFICQD